MNRSFGVTYNVPRSKNSIDDSAAEGSHHSEADEDDGRHQLRERQSSISFVALLQPHLCL